MATRRDRLARRAGRRRAWARRRTDQAAAAFRASDAAVDGLPPGQPQHPGRSGWAIHRAQERSRDALGAAVEHTRMADMHVRKAATVERQLGESVYDDDPDAVERLEAKLEELLGTRGDMNAANQAYRREHREALKKLDAYGRDQLLPYPQYKLTNLSGLITRTRERIKRLKRERENGPADRLITARFASDCAACGARLEKDQQIRYNRSDGARCVTCPAGKTAAGPSGPAGA